MSAPQRALHHLAATASQGVFGAISILLVVPALSNRELGYLAAIETVTYLFATVAGLNLDRVASRFYFNSDEEEYRRNLFTTLTWTSLASIGLSVVIAWLGRNLIATIFPEVPLWPLMALGLTRTCLEIAGRIEQSYQVASGRSKSYALGSILSGTVSIVLSVLFVLRFSLGVFGLFVAQLCAAGCLLLFLIVASAKPRGQGEFRLETLGPALTYAWPLMPTLVVSWVISYFDRVLVNQASGIENLGVYGLALRMASPFLLASSSIARSIYPTFYTIYRTPGEAAASRDGREFAAAVIHAYGFVAIAAMTLGRMLFGAVFGPRGDLALVFFTFIVLKYWISAVGFLSSELLMLAKATKANMVLALIAACVSLALNYWLVPLEGVRGAIAAGVVTALASFLVQLWLARRYVPVDFPYPAYALVLTVLLCTAWLAAWMPGWRGEGLLFLAATALVGRGTWNAVRFFRRRG